MLKSIGEGGSPSIGATDFAGLRKPLTALLNRRIICHRAGVGSMGGQADAWEVLWQDMSLQGCNVQCSLGPLYCGDRTPTEVQPVDRSLETRGTHPHAHLGIITSITGSLPKAQAKRGRYCNVIQVRHTTPAEVVQHVYVPPPNNGVLFEVGNFDMLDL